ncbi:ATPase family AAA domain-containing protein, partial [Trifolium medium]|nr:ATPase family AAA domain-containing protein [Trifolium medium]
DVFIEYEFEKKVLADVISPTEIEITFDDIGALESLKNFLKELVILPLQKTELFTKGQLAKDGLRTKEQNHVLVLAATNRPFDLDEAVIRRLPRR